MLSRTRLILVFVSADKNPRNLMSEGHMPLPGPSTWQSQSPQQALPVGISAPVMTSGYVFNMGLDFYSMWVAADTSSIPCPGPIAAQGNG